MRRIGADAAPFPLLCRVVLLPRNNPSGRFEQMEISGTVASSKRVEFKDYDDWLHTQGVSVDIQESHYNLISRELVTAFSGSEFWTKAVKSLRDVDANYQILNAYPLISVDVPKLVTKPWPSFLHKTYRKNTLSNANFPSPPEDGWVLPQNWYERIHDIVRTTIEVKYLDGVALVLRSLCEVAGHAGCKHQSDLEARASGCYAAHFQCEFSCPIPDISWKRYDQKVMVEVQTTTAIKEVIKRLPSSSRTTAM